MGASVAGRSFPGSQRLSTSGIGNDSYRLILRDFDYLNDCPARGPGDSVTPPLSCAVVALPGRCGRVCGVAGLASAAEQLAGGCGCIAASGVTGRQGAVAGGPYSGF